MWYKNSARMIDTHGLEFHILNVITQQYIPLFEELLSQDVTHPQKYRDIERKMDKEITQLIANSGLFSKPPEFKFAFFANHNGMYNGLHNCIYVNSKLLDDYSTLLGTVKHELIHALDYQYNAYSINPSLVRQRRKMNWYKYYNEPVEVRASIGSIWKELQDNYISKNDIKGYNSFIEIINKSPKLQHSWQYLTPENKKYILQVLYNKLFNSPPEKDVIRKENVV
jgi:hypothetical protein